MVDIFENMVNHIVGDLKKKKGLAKEWKKIDEKTQQDIKNEWKKLLEKDFENWMKEVRKDL